MSDAFKRAAVQWGINRDAYGLDSVWMDLDSKGKPPKNVGEQMVNKVPSWYMEKYERFKNRISVLSGDSVKVIQ